MLKTPLATGSAALAAILASNFLAGTAFAAGSPLGVWLDDRGRGAIEISPCGSALCGKVVWVKSSSDAKGCGAKILGSVKKVGSRTWDHGWIYSPDHGRRFDVALQPVGNDRLRVTGYAGIKLFGESRMWTRAPADLKRCDAPATSVETAKAEIDAGAGPAAKTPDSAPAPAPETAATPTPPVPAPEDEKAPAAGTPAAAPAPAETPAPATTAAGGGAGDDAETDAPPSAGPTVGGLSFDKVLKKTSDGRCKLDLPWVKINFNCKDL